MDYPNPAGLIGTLSLDFADGSHQDFNTDARWQCVMKVSADWAADFSSSEKWVPAMELGGPGAEPWGEFNSGVAPPYVFPRYEAIAEWLENHGTGADFEADRTLRSIHRQVGDCDVYFVANSQTNPIAAPCSFRVSGKVPELWDPGSGTITRQVTFQERAGRIQLPLWLEPSGSVFVVFRPPPHLLARTDREKIVGIKRNGTELLPDKAEMRAALPVTVTAAPNGNLMRVILGEPGQYEITALSGKTRSLEIRTNLPVLELNGPWNVRFQSGRGAPTETVFSKLSDWSQHPNPEIRYFSGIATYQMKFKLAADWLTSGSICRLDLGGVAVIAAVRVNGRTFGSLWSEPYQIDITSGLKRGDNVLEIEVANLWVNRLIGDEDLAEDSERNANGTLKSWPGWLDSPRPSPAGRVTFTSWRLWSKDSPLQPSGLLGPVRLLGLKELLVPFPGESTPGVTRTTKNLLR